MKLNSIYWIISFFVFFNINTYSNYKSSHKRYIVHFKNKNVQLKTESAQTIKKINRSKMKVSLEKRNSFLQEMQNNPDVDFVEEDIYMQAVANPNDLHFSEHWSYSNGSGGIELQDTWDITTGSEEIIIAVLDTGILGNHPDFQGKLLPGADMISDLEIANDGDGRDSDANDPGDWIENGDFCYDGFFNPSSWHGSHVAGTIGAKTNNSIGVSGVNWKAKILPVRVLGKCGGLMSDIADGIRWAAGGNVDGVSVNPNPANVINLSLGGFGSCSSTMQNAIDFANSQGVVVVVAAGNNGTNLEINPFVPATCRGVISVGATNSFGDLTSYSNHGEYVDILAPGGEGTNGVFSISNNGTTVPGVNDYRSLNGTSMAAPHIAGVASLILSVNPGLFPAQVEDIIKKSGRESTYCFGRDCGMGLIDAYQSVILGESIPPNPNFSSDEVISERDELRPDEIAYHYEDDNGGGCGSIDLNGGDGPKGGFGASLLLGILLGFCLVHIRKLT